MCYVYIYTQYIQLPDMLTDTEIKDIMWLVGKDFKVSIVNIRNENMH